MLGLSQVLIETTNGESIVNPYGHDLLAEERSSGWVWHLGDGLGSARQLTDGAGEVTLAQSYAPFGEPLWNEGSGTTGFGFTGERWEAYTQLLFLRARYYEPGIGRFINKDSWGGDYKDPRSLNRFSYVSNRPTRLADPSGASPEDCETWGWTGLAKELICEPIERGADWLIEPFYRTLALGSRFNGWDIGSDLLDHFLDGGGEFVQVSSAWYLRANEAQVKRDMIIQQFVEDYVGPAASSCADWVTAELESSLVYPSDDLEHAFAMAGNYITGFFDAYRHGSEWGMRVTFLVPDRFDFDYARSLDRGIVGKAAGRSTGVGDIPHAWLKRLVVNGAAKPFCMGVVWGEDLKVPEGQWKDWTRLAIWHGGHPVWGAPPALTGIDSLSGSYSVCYGNLCVTKKYDVRSK